MLKWTAEITLSGLSQLCFCASVMHGSAAINIKQVFLHIACTNAVCDFSNVASFIFYSLLKLFLPKADVEAITFKGVRMSAMRFCERNLQNVPTNFTWIRSPFARKQT